MMILRICQSSNILEGRVDIIQGKQIKFGYMLHKRIFYSAWLKVIIEKTEIFISDITIKINNDKKTDPLSGLRSTIIYLKRSECLAPLCYMVL